MKISWVDTLTCYIYSKPLCDSHLTVCCGHNINFASLAWRTDGQRETKSNVAHFVETLAYREEFQHVPITRHKK